MKLSKDKPPLLSDEEIIRASGLNSLMFEDRTAWFKILKLIAQAQRNTDIKFYSEGKLRGE